MCRLGDDDLNPNECCSGKCVKSDDYPDDPVYGACAAVPPPNNVEVEVDDLSPPNYMDCRSQGSTCFVSGQCCSKKCVKYGDPIQPGYCASSMEQEDVPPPNNVEVEVDDVPPANDKDPYCRPGGQWCLDHDWCCSRICDGRPGVCEGSQVEDFPAPMNINTVTSSCVDLYGVYSLLHPTVQI